MIEAVNEKRSDCFGWAIEEVLEETGVRRVRKGECSHHHGNKGNFVGKGSKCSSKTGTCLSLVDFSAIFDIVTSWFLM